MYAKIHHIDWFYSLKDLRDWLLKKFQNNDNVDFIKNFDGKIRMPSEDERWLNLTVIHYLNDEMANQYIAEMFLFESEEENDRYTTLIRTLEQNVGNIDGWSYDVYLLSFLHPSLVSKTHTPASHDAHALRTNSTK